MSEQTAIPDAFLPLLDAACDSALGETQIEELAALLSAEPTVRKVFIDHIQLRRNIRSLCRVERTCDAGLAQVKAILPVATLPDTPLPSLSFLSPTLHGTIGYFSSGWPAAYLVATVICGVGLLIGAFVHVSQPTQVARLSVPLPSSSLSPLHSSSPFVGRITGTVDCRWVQSPESGSRPSPLVSLGDMFDLSSGLMEITYDTGAKVILQGPATYEVESAAGGFLSVGKLTARLAKRSEIRNQKSEIRNQKPSDLWPLTSDLFAIRTPTATITDLGTEFGVEVTSDQACRLNVFQGTVILQTRQSTGVPLQTIELRQDEAACVQSSGVVDRCDGASAETSRMATEFVRELPRRGERTIDVSPKMPNPIDSMPGLLYHLDAAHGVTVDKQGCVRVWSDQSKNGYDFVRGWTSKLVHVAREPSFNNHAVVRNATTNIPGLCLWRDTAPRSIIIVESTAKAGRAGGILGNADCGIRRANPGPSTGWVVTNANVDDFAFGGGFYINGIAGHLQEYDTPGILEAYGPNPREPVFYQTELFGYTHIESDSRWWQGDIAEVIAFDRILTEAERASIVGYLGAKYRIATPFDSAKAEVSSSSPNGESPLRPTGKEKMP
jgi:hypothetical protein